MGALDTAAASSANSFETLSVTKVKPFVYHVELNRPQNLNAFNRTMWREIGVCFNELNENSDCRAIVLSAAGKHFTAGLDLKDSINSGHQLAEIQDVGRKGHALGKKIKGYQESISSLEKCLKPVIVTVHSACIGAGVDLITASDIRYCTEDAWFSVMEVTVGMAADVGSLQRLPKVMNGQSLARELCFTGRKFDSQEAFQCGLISKVFKTKSEMIDVAIELAALISSKSPIAVQATKKSMVYSLDHTNQEGLDQINEMNRLFLQSDDFIDACMAQAIKGTPPVFAKL